MKKAALGVCICLVLLAFVFQREVFLSTIMALISTIISCVIIIAGIYIVIRTLF